MKSDTNTPDNAVRQFEPNFDSLSTFECPAWFRDAKFGVWSHCGPQSVPMYRDWYARHIYLQDSPQYMYHLRHYGHPAEFGYRDPECCLPTKKNAWSRNL